MRKAGGHFLFTAKPSSHKTLYSWLDGAEVASCEQKIKQGARFVTHRYRWLEGVPLRDGKDAMPVNWLEIEIIGPSGKVTYRNSFVTDLAVGEHNVAELAACGRARWKIENESFNTLKTKGYNLEHNFGHGKKHLSAVRATMNLIAFAMHTLADLVDEAWKAARGGWHTQTLLRGSARHYDLSGVPQLGGHPRNAAQRHSYARRHPRRIARRRSSPYHPPRAPHSEPAPNATMRIAGSRHMGWDFRRKRCTRTVFSIPSTIPPPYPDADAFALAGEGEGKEGICQC